MGNINQDYITEYIRSLLPKRTKLLNEMEKEAACEESYVPIAEPETSQMLKVLIHIMNAKNILEIGTGMGYSSIVFANCRDDIKVTTIERYDKVAKRARTNIEKAGLSDRINVIEDDAVNILPAMNDKFDLIFLDAAKGQYIKFLPYLIKLTRTGGVIVSDNVLYKGMTATRDLFVRRKVTIIKRLQEYLKEISNNESLETTIIPIGDGVAVSYVKGEKDE